MILLALIPFTLIAAEPELVDAAQLEPRWRLDIRYATTDNFTGKQLYPLPRCLLRPAVADMLRKAQAHLDAEHPGVVLVLKDCYRPASVQQVMWEAVAGTPEQGYVANPKSGSVHSFGAAVDVTLARADGKELDMGTAYDHLGQLAQPRHEERFLAEGKLTRAQVDNRRILRRAMLAAGFLMIRSEWWHFDAARGAELRRRYRKLDLPLDVKLDPPSVEE